MIPFKPYRGEDYRDFDWLVSWCEDLAAARPDLVHLGTYGQSRHGRPLLLITLSLGEAEPGEKAAFWLDAGTHASEWAGMMACLYSITRWVEGVDSGDAELVDFFTHHTLYIAPCLSPDGFQHLMDGGAFVRSTLREPPRGVHRQGLEPQDVDGDGEVLWMRWRHPTGSWVIDDELPMLMRRRRVDDPPEAAYVVCHEGMLLDYDGTTWVQADARHGLDMNRNFPSRWEPFRQFGMDGGALPLSEPESRGVAEAVQQRPNICAVLTCHTYTGAILVGPYRADNPFNYWDKETLYQLAAEAVEGTGWRAIQVYPDFIYVEGVTMPGVWADHLTTNLGIPAYTLEIWDPFAYAGITLENPARFFSRPDEAVVKSVVKVFAQDPSTWEPWRPFDHPQLGEVEIGGFRQVKTFRNPPVKELAAECHKAFTVADRLRRSLPRPRIQVTVETEGGVSRICAQVENVGYLSTGALQRASSGGMVPPPRLVITLPKGAALLSGEKTVVIDELSGWGDAPATFRRHPLFNTLPTQSQRARITWLVRGAGKGEVTWRHPRSGVVSSSFELV